MKVTSLLSNLILVFAIFIAGCGQGPSAQKAKSSSSGNNSTDCVDGVCSDIPFAVKVQKTEGIVSQRQLLTNYKSCLGVNTISTETQNAFNEALSSLSLDGLAKDVNAPLMMGVAKISSEICLDLVNQEKTLSSRKFFQGFTLSGTTAIDNAQTFDLKKTLQTLSSSCWGRKITDAEAAIITTKVTTKDTAAAIVACTVILSSAEAIRF